MSNKLCEKTTMKTVQDFEAIIDEFRNTVEGKVGKAFIDGALIFMKKHHFEQEVIKKVYEDDDILVTCLTDNVENEVGIFIIECPVIPFYACFVGNYMGVKNTLQNM